MADSGTETITEVREFWPHQAKSDKTEKGLRTILFQPVDVTIKRVVKGRGVGWVFTEDTTKSGEYVGVIWNSRGKWDKENNRALPYDGPDFKAGVRVQASLCYREYWPKDSDERGVAHDVVFIEAVASAPEVTSNPKEHRVDRPARPQMDRDTSIVTQVAFIRLTELLAAGKLPMHDASEPPVLTNWGADWCIFYEAMKRGLLPAWPERDSTVTELPDDVENEPKDLW